MGLTFTLVTWENRSVLGFLVSKKRAPVAAGENKIHHEASKKKTNFQTKVRDRERKKKGKIVSTPR